MKDILFQIPYYSVSISNWKKKKAKINEVLKDYPVVKLPQQNFLTNRQQSRKKLIPKFLKIFQDDFKEFLLDVQADMGIKDIWSIVYKKHHDQIIHNHGSTGYSGVLYLNFNPAVHLPNTYLQPWNHAELDVSVFNRVPVQEGVMIIVPSFINHFVAANTSSSPREVIAFDMYRLDEKN